MVTRDAPARGGVICETKRIWSHYLLLDREESLPTLAPSLCKGTGPLQPINATTPWRGFVEQITLLRAALAASAYNSRGRLIEFFNSLLVAQPLHSDSHRRRHSFLL